MSLAPEEHAGPPWVIFADGGRPYAIMPAGRPGDVAIVNDLDPELVRRIVACANARSHDVDTGIHNLTSRLEAIQARLNERDTELLESYRRLAEAADAVLDEAERLSNQPSLRRNAYREARSAVRRLEQGSGDAGGRGAPVAEDTKPAGSTR